jgi:Flp pilus assembly pilin Flp
MKSIIRYFRDDSGADLVEYALLVGVVALGAIVGLAGVRDAIVGMFNTLAGEITDPDIPAPPGP